MNLLLLHILASSKATDAYLNRVRQFYSQRPFVVPAQRVEVWPFPTPATLTGIRTSQNIPLSHVPTSAFYSLKMQELRLALKILAIRTCKQPPADEIFQICL
ncbi:MAG: hypothetical protein EZS28_043539 [Streblomastix strix]|uniref:HECT domain-containing protein n=1 Tax=Streblomastix strix TaxID=222440 RepID=A0A5J4TRE9_9EUKA|nr:MAG: hypothetical protein EZS28_043539 [Streblomastix strix]